MGTFVFKWEHPASEVYVTGTFDDWNKTEKLDKVGEHFEKNVALGDASKKIFYKFVVDGNWVTDHTAPKETDESGNENNVLTPDRIVAAEPSAPAATMASTINTVTPESTTAALAGQVPLEKNKKDEESSDLPGAFPETPAADLDKQVKVDPLPAAPGAVNPIQLAPGDKIPQSIIDEGTTSNVKLDPESYENSDALPGVNPFISSVGPNSTTAELAGQVPLEGQVPPVVKDSQEKANADPEASAVPAEVQDKAKVESELLDKVQEAPSTSEGTAGKGTEKTESTVTAGEAAASVAAAATALGAAAATAAVAAKDAVVENAAPVVAEQAAKLPESVKEQLPASVQEQIGGTSKEETIQEVSPQVPAEVKESIAEAGKSPEAAASTAAVEDKKAVEQELLKEVKPAEASAAATAEKTADVPATGAAATDATTLEATATATTAEEAAAVAAKADTNGAAAAKTTDSTTPAKPAADSTPANGTATAEKKKKNRISAFISKLKSKTKEKSAAKENAAK